MTRHVTTLQILLVEDNPVDVLTTREALTGWKSHNDVHVMEDGEAALDFLCKRGRYREAPRPDLILLDLNLPKRSGTEVLSEIKKDPALSAITVVVVTTSDAVSDLHACHELGAKQCITKPLDFEEYVAAIQSLEECWFSAAG